SLLTLVPRSVRCRLSSGTGADIGIADTLTIFITLFPRQSPFNTGALLTAQQAEYRRRELTRPAWAMARRRIAGLRCRPSCERPAVPAHWLRASGPAHPGHLWHRGAGSATPIRPWRQNPAAVFGSAAPRRRTRA